MVRTAVLSAVAILAGCGVLPGVGIDPALPAQSANRSEASPELQFTVLEPTMHSPGQKCWFELVVRNPGNQPVCIPISGAPPTLASVLKVRAGLVGGGEEVTYPPYAPDPSGAVALVTILPGTEERLRTWFIPWVPGEYEWTLTLENHLASRTELLRTGSGGSERWVSLPIPNAWVGRSLFTGRIVPLEDGPAGGAEVRRRGRLGLASYFEEPVSFKLADAPGREAIEQLGRQVGADVVFDYELGDDPGEPVTLKVKDMNAGMALRWVILCAGFDCELRRGVVYVYDPFARFCSNQYLEDLESPLRNCMNVVTNGSKPLPLRLGYLDELVAMRHVHAANVLAEIERKTRGRALIHPHVVRALCEMAFLGAGYRNLHALEEIWLDPGTSEWERALCVRTIGAFAHTTGFYDRYITHEVGASERKIAGEMMRRILKEMKVRSKRQ